MQSFIYQIIVFRYISFLYYQCIIANNIFCIFSSLGGGRRRQQRGEDMVHPLKVTLEDLYKGKLSKLQLSKKVICAKCKGQGGKEGAMQPCVACRGRGVKVTMRQLAPGMVQQMQSHCTDCNGEGLNTLHYCFYIKSLCHNYLNESHKLLGFNFYTQS